MSKEMAPPPSSFGKGQRGKPVVKPKDMKGTLRRLWELTQGQRQGLGWLMLLSAVASASTILSPLLIGTALTAIDTGNPALQLAGTVFTAVFYGGHRAENHSSYPQHAV